MSDYTLTAPVPTTEQLKLLGKDILFDGDFHVGPNGDYVLIEGEEAVRQAIYRRLMTRPGEFKRRPDYGVGVQSYVKRRRTSSVISELRGRIIDQLSLESRLEEVIEVTVARIDDGIQIAILCRVYGKAIQFRPFEFTERSVITRGV